MFGLSWTELGVTLIVAILVIRPSDLPEIVTAIGKGIRTVKNAWNELSTYAEDIINDSELHEAKRQLEQEITMIEDAEGNLYEAYNVSEIKRDLESVQKNKEKA